MNIAPVRVLCFLFTIIKVFFIRSVDFRSGRTSSCGHHLNLLVATFRRGFRLILIPRSCHPPLQSANFTVTVGNVIAKPGNVTRKARNVLFKPGNVFESRKRYLQTGKRYAKSRKRFVQTGKRFRKQETLSPNRETLCEKQEPFC